jgi:hypothetical protein
MDELRYTLLTDGSSDDALMPVLSWLLTGRLTGCAIQEQWADLRRLPTPPRGLANRITSALELYPCELLFVHRDAETASADRRISEIRRAISEVASPVEHVCVVPVRMTEAWLLFDEAALRRAAENPNGRIPLQLPPFQVIEQIPNPKQLLRELLRRASELSGRRLRKLSDVSARRVAALINDFSPLRNLPAFRRLEADVDEFAEKWLANAPDTP